jgi:hypothetical protein
MEPTLAPGEHETWQKTLSTGNRFILTSKRAIYLSRKNGPTQYDLHQITQAYKDEEGLVRKWYGVQVMVAGRHNSTTFVGTYNKQERDEILAKLQEAMLGGQKPSSSSSVPLADRPEDI